MPILVVTDYELRRVLIAVVIVLVVVAIAYYLSRIDRGPRV